MSEHLNERQRPIEQQPPEAPPQERDTL